MFAFNRGSNRVAITSGDGSGLRRRPTRGAAVRRAAGRAVEALESRRLMCALSHEHLIEAPQWSDAIEQRAQAEQLARGGPDAVGGTSIIWTNRGQVSDNFTATFGTSAAGMRNIVDAALDHWERVITDWNRADNTTTLQVTVSISGSGFGGAAAPAGVAPADGKPRTGGITLGSGSNDADPNSSNGWYLDPNPDDHAEFNGTIMNAFASNGPAGIGNDFYSVVVAELTHVLGLVSDKFNNGGDFDGYLLESSGFLTDTNIADSAEGNGNGEFWVFEGPTIDHLMTTFNSGDPTATSWGNIVHSSGPGGGIAFNGQTWWGSDDAGNAFYGTGERTLPSFAMAHVLADAYGYSITEPQTFGTFYAMLNESTGALTIRGGLLNGDDKVIVNFDGADYTVSVDVGIDPPGTGAFSGLQNLPAWVSTFSASQVSSITIDTSSGDDEIFVNGTDAPVTVNAGTGDDLISVGGGDIDSNLDANVTVNGDGDSDQVIFNDITDTAGGNDYYLTVNRLEKNNDLRRVYYETTETLLLLGSQQSSVYDIAFLPEGVTASVFAGSGNDTFNVAQDDIDTNLDSDVSITGAGGTDAIVFNDTGDGANSDVYELTSSRLTKAPLGENRTVSFFTMESLTLNGSNQPSTYNVLSVAANVPTTINGGSGDDTFNVADGDINSDIDSNVTINGNAGDDEINFDDSADAFGSDIYTVGQLVFSKSTRDFRYGTVEAINLTGSPQDDTLNLNGSPAGTVITLSTGAGDDEFLLGSGDLGTVLTGFVLQGQAGADALVIDDAADTEDDTYTLSDDTFSKTFVNTNTRRFADYAGMESLVLSANADNNTINVEGTHASTPVTINGGAGNDAFNVGAGLWDGAVFGAVTVNGNLGSDAIVIDDSNDTGADGYGVSGTQTVKIGGAAAPVTHNTIESYELAANSDANLIRVNGTVNGDAMVRGRGGADQFDVIDVFAGQVLSIEDGPDLDQLNVNSDGAGTAAVQFETDQDYASLQIGPGGSATLLANGDRSIYTQSLGMTSTSLLDLADNDLILDYTGASPMPGIIGVLIAGFNGGGWNGAAGITSSVAALGTTNGIGVAEATDLFTTFPATFAGVSVDNTSILLKYTFNGDTNLDGNVNLTDFNRLASNFGQSPRGWVHGNSNFDNIVNLADFNRLAANFGGTGLLPPNALPGTGGEEEAPPKLEDLVGSGSPPAAERGKGRAG